MKDFASNTSSFIYNPNSITEEKPGGVETIKLLNNEHITWLNTYGLSYSKEFTKIIHANKLDEFLQLLIKENKHRNKVIELEETMFLAINTIHLNSKEISTEQMMFVLGENFVWSIQEKPGDYFQDIRYRLRENKGLVRKKNSDYLLYLIIDAIIDNYSSVYEKINGPLEQIQEQENPETDQENVLKIENGKQQLFQLKKAIASLRETIFKLENSGLDFLESRYFSEAKEQANYLMDDIDFDLNQLESKLNLIFNLQNNRLNQVMKTLTIFSVIFIPLTFLAGIYGMNFDHMPGTKAANGFYIFLLVTVFVTLLSIYMINRRNWFK
jgi:magnesium transporter